MIVTRRRFHSFDFFRFFAFFKVFLLHLPLTAFPIFSFFKNGGEIGVYFFFSLSGFLITYILLEEKKQLGTISLSNFFSRRILRIWPLYYIMILFAFVTPYILRILGLTSLPEGYEPNWLVSVLFLENYKMILTDSFPNVSPLRVMWSLCVEEHFYIIWGLFLYFTKIKNVRYLIIGAIVVANISRVIFYTNDLSFLDLSTNLDYFMFGAIPALLLVSEEKKVLSHVNRIPSYLKYLLLIFSLAYIVVSPNFYFPHKALIDPTIYGIAFCSILLMALPENSIIRISDRNIFSRLGIYTYGLYLTHTIVINLFIKLFEKWQLSLDHGMNALLFATLSLLVTICVSMLTYRFIEKPFLRAKKYFR